MTDSADRALLAVGTASYESTEFGALHKVPASLQAVVDTLSGLGFSTVIGAPGYGVDLAPADLRVAVRRAAVAAPVVVLY